MIGLPDEHQVAGLGESGDDGENLRKSSYNQGEEHSVSTAAAGYPLPRNECDRLGPTDKSVPIRIAGSYDEEKELAQRGADRDRLIGRKTMQAAPRTVDVGDSRLFEAAELPSFISRQVSEARRYYFDLAHRCRAKIYVALGGWERVRADYAIHRPQFSFYSIEFVAEGRGHIELGGRQFKLSPGSVFGYGPESPLEMFAHANDLMSKYYVTFHGRYAQAILKTAGLFPNGFQQVHARHEIRDLFEMLMANGMAHSRFSQAICASILPTLAYKIAEQAMAADSVKDRAFETYLHVRNLFDQEFLEFANLEQAAARCGLTVSYICQLFKRFDHISPYKYLVSRRMRFAADMLSNSDVLVKQAAKRLGFADQFQFSRAFKRVFGISPSQFQRRLVPAQSTRSCARRGPREGES